MRPWPFHPLRPLGYGTILADPPWRFALRSQKGEGKSPQAHYDCMGLDEIMRLPVHGLARGDCLLWMWATWPILRHAMDVLEAWGFRYVTGGAWHKKTRHGKSAFGTGYVLRSACEPFLIGKIGNPQVKGESTRNIIETFEIEFGNVIEARAREHSRKPPEAQEILERICPRDFRVELFSRTNRPGWDAWGDELGKFEEAS